MKSKALLVAVTAVFVAGAFGLLRLRGHHANLRKELAELQRQNRTAETARRENERLKAFVVQTKALEADDESSRRSEIERSRREVAELEKRAALSHAQVNAGVAAEAAALASNRDPERGMTRLDYFQNVGRATPAMALQTLIWAALKGDDKALADALLVSADGRNKAEALLARLPPGAQEKYPSAERLAAIAVAAEMLKGSALEISGCTLGDAEHATVQIRMQGGKEAKLLMQPGPGGWQLVVPERAIDAIGRRLGEVAAGEAPKK